MLQPQTIHAGDTPLACTLTVAQTGPMALTVRAGHFTTTGEARIALAGEAGDADALVAAGRAEWLPDGAHLRLWLLGPDGQPLARSATHTLAAEAVLPLSADPTSDKLYLVELGLANGTPDVLCRSQLAGEALPAPPAGWTPLHWLAGPFVVPPGTTDLAGLPIPVFTVLPGFPAGTTAADWRVQQGGA